VVDNEPHDESFESWKVRHLIRVQDSDFIVYLDDEVDLEWRTSNAWDDNIRESGWEQQFSEIIARAASLEAAPWRGFDDKTTIAFRRSIGEGIAFGLEGNFANAKKMLDDAESFRIAHIEHDRISDLLFIKDLKRLRELKSFFLQEAINPNRPIDSAPSKIALKLNVLRYASDGRSPTEAEWLEVQQQTQALFNLLTETLRRRFLRGEVPAWMTWLPVAFAVIAMLALIAAIFVTDLGFFGIQSVGARTLPFYVIWLIALGAIGSAAFIGMNALSIQEDITFDLTNRRLMLLRVALGALFALVLTLPFGFGGFVEFCQAILAMKGSRSTEVESIKPQAILLLLPFILGFSTTLVIMILNRFVAAVQTFFGAATERPSFSKNAISVVTTDQVSAMEKSSERS
jgi:hypothetical protein